MNHHYYRLGLLLALWPLVQLASGQPLTIAGLNPVRNARSAPQTTNVDLLFNQGLNANAATLNGVRVFSAQRGGLRRNSQGGSASVSGSTLSFNPATSFKPGETVFVTSTTAIQATGGARLSGGRVHQFTTGVGGSGQGNFTPPATNAEPAIGDRSDWVAVGDVDGDGDLDMLTANFFSFTVSVRLNDGSGNFTPPATNPEPGVGGPPTIVVLGDLDGDGDLDFVTANPDVNTVSVRLNNGSGNFTAPATNPNPEILGRPISVALGDVDGDGDLDLVTANSGSTNTVSVRLNNGSGNFSAPTINPNPGVGRLPYSVALGDLDGDGDLDLVTVNFGDGNASVRLNDGSGNFTTPTINANPGIGSLPNSVVLGDVDGDGDLDMLWTNGNSGYPYVTLVLNDGSGNFTRSPGNPVEVGSSPRNVVLGDMDGDGDLDFVTANAGSNTVSVRLNDGSGNFTAPAINPNPGVGIGPSAVALGDLDGDGDLDFVTDNYSSATASVRLNGPFPPLTLTGLVASPSPVCAGQPLSVVASVGNLTASYSYTLTNGSNTISGTATSSAFSQSLTASGSGGQSFTLTVSSRGEVVTATTSVTVTRCVTLSGLVASPNPVCAGQSITFRASVGSLSGSYSYTLSNGSNTTSGTATASAFTQPLTASSSGVQTFTLTVATPDQRATATTSVTVTQCLTLTELAPGRNERYAPVQSSVNLTFNQVLSNNAATLGGVRVFSAQRGGLLRNGQGGTASITGLTGGNSNRLRFDPSTDFKPGETVFVTSTTAIQTAGGNTGPRQVYQFTTGVGGSGQGYFTPPAVNPNPGVGDTPFSVAVGDVDGDGDLDMLTANRGTNTVSVRLNDGAGNYTAPATNPNPGVGNGPRSVALGDVDGDGDLDMLTANELSSTVSVRLNNGAGNFTTPATNPNPGVGNQPVSVALGDVDGDGDLDLLTVNYNSDNVSVRLNDGSGNFTPPAINPNPGVGDYPQSVALGDVDGDGDLDFVTANYNPNTVSVRLNDGSGNFTAHPTNPNPGVGSGANSVALGDVDGDGDLDLLCANRGNNTVSVRLNDGSGNFTVPAVNPNPGVGSAPYSVVLGDVDGDSDLDLLTANGVSNNVSVRLNDGSGNFTARAINPELGVGSAPYSVALGDVDGDGDLDLLSANGVSDNVSVRLNSFLFLTGVSASPNPVCAGQPLSVVASVGNLTGSYSYTLSNGSTVISGTATTPVFSQSLTASGSGVQPFTLTVSSAGQVVTATTDVTVSQCIALTGLNPVRNARSAPQTTNVDLTFSQPISASPASLSGVRVFSAQRGGLLRNGVGGTASVSGSTLSFNPATNFKPGEPVFVTSTTAIQSTGGLRLSRGQVYGFTTQVGGSGRGDFIAPAINPDPGVGSSPANVALGDVDGDGDLDLVTANRSSDNVSVRLNDGSGNYIAPAINPNPGVGDYPLSVALGDVDGDGDLDLVTGNGNSDNVSVRLNDGSGNFTAPAINPNPGAGSFPNSVALGDLDGDGDLDLLCANFSGDNVSVRLNDGSGNFTAPALNPNPGVGDGPQSVAVGDVDGDGDLDLLTANSRSDNVSVRLNDGSGNFTPPAINPNPGVGDYPWSVVLGDVDGDGDLDFVTAHGGLTNTVSVRLNDGSGNFTPPPLNPDPLVGNAPLSVALGDVDGDGDLDLLCAIPSSSNTVSVRLNDGSGNFTAPATNPNTSVGKTPYSVALGDVDGDGDLDFVTANVNSDNVSVRLNGGGIPTPADLTLLLFAQPTLVYGPTTVSVVVSVYELNGVATSAPVSVKLSEDALLKLGFDPVATSVGGKPVQNPSWQFSGPVDGIYTLTSSQSLPAGGRLSVGLSGPLTPGATKGKLSVSATVVDPSGTETRLNNNQDAETIEYFNK